MNNILNIDLVKGLRSITSSQSDTNKIILNINIENSFSNPYLEIKKQDNSTETITDLAIESNVISYELPFRNYNEIGNVEIKVKADGYESESIIVNILESLIETDDIIVKIENDIFVVKKIIKTKNMSIVNLVYPIGSVYKNENLVNPEQLFGGTWEKVTDGTYHTWIRKK